jgi:hypothetical protein
MMWVGLLFATAITVQWPAMWKQKLWKEFSVHMGFLILGLFITFLVSSGEWLRFDALVPLKAMFQPMTEWFYNIL